MLISESFVFKTFMNYAEENRSRNWVLESRLTVFVLYLTLSTDSKYKPFYQTTGTVPSIPRFILFVGAFWGF